MCAELDILEKSIFKFLLGEEVNLDNQIIYLANTYRNAGLKAIANSDEKSSWIYLRIDTEKSKQDNILFQLGKTLDKYIESNIIDQYWFMRKSNGGQHIRLRFRNSTNQSLNIEAKEKIEAELSSCFIELGVTRYCQLPYEPEVNLFGGEVGIEFAHEYFYLDSKLIIQLVKLTKSNTEKKFSLPEMSIWLINYTYKCIGLDLFEIWDTWMKVYKLRYVDMSAIENVISKNIEIIKKILELSSEEFMDYVGDGMEAIKKQLIDIKDWGVRFQISIQNGNLSRGIREILSYITIFHWNRCNFSAGVQGGLACMVALASESKFNK